MITQESKHDPPISESRIRDELSKILASNGFFRAPRMRGFLRFVVEGRLAGQFQAEDLKESVIGVAVFDRDASYDPKSDPVVKVEARRLRTKLEEYYAGPGQMDAIRIELPKGSYAPNWAWQREAKDEPRADHELSYRNGWLVLVTLALFAILLSGVLVRWNRNSLNRASPVTGSKIRSLAILPFRNLSGDSSKDYIVAGLTDEITTELAKIRNLKVISRTSADQYRGTRKRLPELARELNVDAVLEGTFLSSQHSVRVNAQLIRADTDTHLWAETYERNGEDLFTLETEITDNIAREIGVRISPESKEATSEVPSNGQAYEAYLRGRYFWNRRTLDGLEKSILNYKLAISDDAKYGKAYAGLGDSYVLLSSYGGPAPSETLMRARQAAEEALRLDPDLAEAYTVLAAVKVDNDWDWDGATKEFQRAIQLSPGYPTAHHWFSLHLTRLGRHAEAEAEINRALELDPLSLIINTDAGETYYCARKPDQALVYLRRALELDTNFAEAHLVLGKVNEEKHEFAPAIAEYKLADKLFGGAPNVWALQGHALALWGKRREALAVARKLEEASKRRYVSGVDRAMVYCGLGEHDSAMSLLETGYAKRDKGLNILAADPLFDGCRSDSRFQELLTRLRLTS